MPRRASRVTQAMPWVTKRTAAPTLGSTFQQELTTQTLADTMTETANSALPQYGGKPNKPGLYLGLFHGRHDRNDQMIE